MKHNDAVVRRTFRASPFQRGLVSNTGDTRTNASASD